MGLVVGVAIAAVEAIGAVSAAVGAAATSAGLIGAAGGLTSLGSTVLGFAATAAIYGVEKLLTPAKAQAQNFQSPPTPISYDTQAQSIAARFYQYGNIRTGGIFIYRKSISEAYLCYGIVLSCRPLDGVSAYYIDDELMVLSSGPENGITWSSNVQWPNRGLKYGPFTVQIPTFNKGQVTLQPIQTHVGPYCYIEHNPATPAGKQSEILSFYAPKDWGNTHLAIGLETLYSEFRVVDSTQRLTRYPNGLPQHTTLVRGARVFDPRDSSQTFLQNGTYSVYNTTWVFSKNPALQIADYLTFPDGMNLKFTDINWSSVTDSANFCDAIVASLSGTRKFAESSIEWTSDQEPRDVLTKLEAACDGQIYEDADGKVNIWIAQWIEPSVVLTDADLCAPITWNELNGILAEQNVIIPTYVEPRSKNGRNDSLRAIDQNSVSQIGELRSSLSLDAVQDFNQAYDLALRGLKRKNTPLKISCALGPRGLLVDGERVVRIKSNFINGGIDAVFRVMSLKISGDMSRISAEFHLVTPDMFSVSVPPFDPLNPLADGTSQGSLYVPQTPVQPTATTAVVTGGVTIAASVLAPVSPSDPNAVANFRSREVDPSTHVPIATDWTYWTFHVDALNMTSPTLSGASGTTHAYEIQAWFTSTSNIPSAFSPSLFVSVTY